MEAGAFEKDTADLGANEYAFPQNPRRTMKSLCTFNMAEYVLFSAVDTLREGLFRMLRMCYGPIVGGRRRREKKTLTTSVNLDLHHLYVVPVSYQ
jgi:hypothetical protein